MGIRKVYRVIAILSIAIALPLLAGCSAGVMHPSVSPSAKAAPVSESERKTISSVISTAKGTFSPCQQWVPINSTFESSVYLRRANCILLPHFAAFNTVDNKPLWCNPLPNGDAALGVIYSGAKVDCTYVVPVAG